MSILIDEKASPIEVWFGSFEGDDKKSNVVYLKPFLSIDDIKILEKGSFNMSMTEEEARKAANDDSDALLNLNFSTTETMISNLKVAVRGWSGPMFAGIRYNRGIWGRLKADECLWWITLVNEKVNELNNKNSAPPTENGDGPDPTQNTLDI
jgi:hypothetical protein